MKNVDFKGFFNDLYRDIRDRRLLLPIVGLVVAIVAVPVLLGGGSEAAPPAAETALDPELGAEVSPAVLVSDPGIRNYRKRLEQLKKTNPFEQRYAEKATPEAALESVVPDLGSADTGGAGGAPAAPSPSVSDSSPSMGSSGTGSSAVDTPDTDPTVTPATPDQPKPEIRFYAGRVDISFGPLGKEAKQYDDVRELDLIPGDKNPLAAFVGLAGDGEQAVFTISPSIVNTSGDGSCAPKKPDPCQYLRLAKGETRFLKTEGGKSYKLRLRHTNVVRIPDPRKNNGGSAEESGK
jgi:hypothetical protein